MCTTEQLRLTEKQLRQDIESRYKMVSRGKTKAIANVAKARMRREILLTHYSDFIKDFVHLRECVMANLPTGKKRAWEFVERMFREFELTWRVHTLMLHFEKTPTDTIFFEDNYFPFPATPLDTVSVLENFRSPVSLFSGRYAIVDLNTPRDTLTAQLEDIWDNARSKGQKAFGGKIVPGRLEEEKIMIAANPISDEDFHRLLAKVDLALAKRCNCLVDGEYQKPPRGKFKADKVRWNRAKGKLKEQYQELVKLVLPVMHTQEIESYKNDEGQEFVVNVHTKISTGEPVFKIYPVVFQVHPSDENVD